MHKYLLLIIFCNLTVAETTLAGAVDPLSAIAEHNKSRNLLNRGELGVQTRPDPFIQDMYWDEQLAESAQSHTDQCVWKHSGSGGENLYAHSGAYGSLTEGIVLWVDEQKDYDFDNNTSTGVTGHYTQVIWDESLRVGCAATQCSPIMQPDGSAMWDGVMYACQYRQSGNWAGYQPYGTAGNITSRVEYNSANKNLNFQLLKIGNTYFRAKMGIKSYDPLQFHIITYEKIVTSRANGQDNIAYYNIEKNALIVPRLSIDGSDRYQMELEHIGNLIFEISGGGER